MPKTIEYQALFLIIILGFFNSPLLAKRLDGNIIQPTKPLPIIQVSSLPDYTIFIGGAGFNGKYKENKKDKQFTHNLISTYDQILSSNDYHTVKNSARFMGILRNSIYTIKFGHVQVPCEKLNKFKHRALRKSAAEVYNQYKDANGIDINGNQTTEPLNLAGSSYGSVVAAQIAIRLIEKYNLKVKTLTLSASSIDEFATNGLGNLLIDYETSGDIEKIIWHPNPDDDITGASGKVTIWQLVFQGVRSDKKSILSPLHPHNVASKNIYRSKEIVQETIIDANSENDPTVQAAAQIIINQ